MQPSFSNRLALAAATLWLAMMALPSHAQLMAEYVAPSLLTGTISNFNPRASTGTLDVRPATARPRPASSLERWERFETEFGIRTKDDSLMRGSLRQAKYQLDRTTFAMQELLDNVEDSLRFDYGLEDLGLPVSPQRSTHSNPLRGSWDNVRLKSDIDLKIAGRSFVGVKLVLPIGD